MRTLLICASGTIGRAVASALAKHEVVHAGLEGFTRGAALEAPRGVRVNVVRMKMSADGGLPGGDHREGVRRERERQPGRPGDLTALSQ